MLKDRPCDVPKCIIEEIDFECTFLGNTSSKENYHDNNPENESCIDDSTSVLLSLGCVFGGSLAGISIFVSLKRWMRNKQRDGGDLSEGRFVTISSPQGTDYADIEDTIRMVAKAIQVPSYKEDSSSETRSRENIYHHLSLTEDSTKKENRDLVSSDSIPDSFADDMIISNKGSPSFKSVVIYAESSSSKSNGNSKISPTGSTGSDKYYALE